MTRPAPPEDERARVAEALRAILDARPEIRFACLHGSFARGEPYRDIDVAIWVDAALVAPEARVGYGFDLATGLDLAPGQHVDIQILNDAPLAFSLPRAGRTACRGARPRPGRVR